MSIYLKIHETYSLPSLYPARPLLPLAPGVSAPPLLIPADIALLFRDWRSFFIRFLALCSDRVVI